MMDIRAVMKRLDMRLRGQPWMSPLRTAYRLARSFERFVPSKTLPDELLRDCRFCSSRAAILDLLPKGGCVAEVGTYKGDFARVILERNAPRQLDLIDVNFSYLDPDIAADARVKCHEGPSDIMLTRFSDACFDWIYIDAEHSYNAVLADARACVAKLKPGGYLLFNDFTHIDPFLGRYGVHRAVTDFVLETSWPVRFLASNEYAVYDVGLQKP